MARMTAADMKAMYGHIRGDEVAVAPVVSIAGVPTDGQGTAPVADLGPNPYQYRTVFDVEKLNELADSIAMHGLAEPIGVRRTGEGRLQIIYGERRWRAYKILLERATTEADKARWAAIPVLEKRGVSDDEMEEMAIIENTHREDPDEVTVGERLASMQERRGLTVAQLAERISKPVHYVERAMRLTRTIPAIKEGVQKGLMITLTGEKGEPLSTPTGRPKREHRKLDMMAALAFHALHQHLVKGGQPKAEQKVAGLVEQALAEGWSFRRVQDVCQGVREKLAEAPAVSGAGEGSGPASEGAVTAPPAPPFRSDGRQLVVYRARIASASPEQRAELQAQLQAVLAEVIAAGG